MGEYMERIFGTREAWEVRENERRRKCGMNGGL